MTASRGSYEVTLITKKDSAWVPDKQQKNCYVCTKVKLRGGNRHHCRLCGNVACKDCCPRICKKCLAEKLVPSSPSGSFGGGSSEITVQFQRLCQLKCKQIKWKRVEMIDKIYYEPVYIISEDSTNICIVRNVDGDYFAIDKNTLFLAPEKENMLDSIQCLLHGFINRSSESSISLRKPLYALGEDNSILNESMINKRKSFSSNNNKILKRSNIFSFYPMLQKESYKLEGFLLKSSLHKMNINNVQLFHFVSDEESPKKIPAFNSDSNVHSDDEKQINNNDIIISANSRRKSPSMGDLKKKNIAVLELELDSFKKGYQEMRKMYEEYVSANESKVKEHEELISKLQKEVDDTTQSKAKYKQAVDINANQVRELQEQILKLKSEYQIKLNSQSDKYKNSSEKTTNDAQSQLIESCKNLQLSNNKIKQLEEEIIALKSIKIVNKIDSVNQFRLEKQQERYNKLEIELKESNDKIVQLTMEYKDKNNENENESENENNNKFIGSIRDKIGIEYNKLFENEYAELFDLLFNLILSYRSIWNKEYIYVLIYELLFNILIESFSQINKFEKQISLILCKELSINKDILYESFYNEWIKNSNYEIFLHSTDKINEIKNYLIDILFIEKFILKYLNLNSHQIAEEIHLKFAQFVDKCINISWQMSIQYPVLKFTPNKFNVEQLNKIKYHKELHNIYHINNNDNNSQFILYYIWPIISHNNFHSIVENIKIQVCLGSIMPKKMNEKNNNNNNDNDNDNDNDNNINSNGNEDVDDDGHNDADDSVGMIIFDHDDNYNNQIGDDDSYYDHHLQDEY